MTIEEVIKARAAFERRLAADINEALLDFQRVSGVQVIDGIYVNLIEAHRMGGESFTLLRDVQVTVRL